MPPAVNRESALESAGRALWQGLRAEARGDLDGEFGFGDSAAIDLRAELAKPGSETLSEVVQHLRDLGYLTTPATIGAGLGAFGGTADGSKDAPLLAEALTNYRADETTFARWFAIKPARGWTVTAPVARAEAAVAADPLRIDSATLLRLRALTSLDGVLDFREVPGPGETGLPARVIHHLLVLYGILPDTFRPGTPYGPATASALRGLVGLMKIPSGELTPVGLLNRLTDFDAMADRIAGQGGTWDLSLPAPGTEGWSDSIAAQRTAVARFRKAAHLSVAGENIIWDPSDRQVFGVRMLQVYLWHRGHYFGEIDALWGQESDASLRRAAVIHAPAAPGGGHPVDAFLTETEGAIRIRLAAFIRCCRQSDTRTVRSRSLDEETTPEEDLHKLQNAIRQHLEEIGREGNAGDAEIRGQEARVWNSLFEKVNAGPGSRSGGIARRNFDMGMIGRGIRRILEDLAEIAAKIMDMAGSFLERVKEFVKGLVANLTGAALQAVQLLKRGLTGAIRVATQAGRRVLRLISGEPYLTVQREDRFRFEIGDRVGRFDRGGWWCRARVCGPDRSRC